MGPTRSPGTLPRPYSALQPPYCVSLTPKLPLALSPYSLFLPTSVSSISHSLLHSSYCIYLPLPLSLTESPTPFSFLPCSSSFPPTPSRHTPSHPTPCLLLSSLPHSSSQAPFSFISYFSNSPHVPPPSHLPPPHLLFLLFTAFPLTPSHALSHATLHVPPISPRLSPHSFLVSVPSQHTFPLLTFQNPFLRYSTCLIIPSCTSPLPL